MILYLAERKEQMMSWTELIDEKSPNKELIEKILEAGNTRNEFQYFNIDNPNNMNKVYDYYSKYAETLIHSMRPDNNIFNKKK